MLEEPIAPLTVPAFLTSVGIGKIIAVLFALLFIVWLIYTAVAAYHWLRYGHRSAVAIPALIVHVMVSWLLAGYAVSGVIG